DRMAPIDWHSDEPAYDFSSKFLYVDNDADRLLNAARFMIVIPGIVLGVLLFCWAHERLGFGAAGAALASYALSPTVQAHSALVTTDIGVACFIFGTIYFLWRTVRQTTRVNVGGLTVFFALAVVSKFSALILGPIVAILLGAAVWRRTMPWRT